MVEKWVIDFNQMYLSIYLDGVWWTINSNVMLKWIYWEYSFDWCTIMGGIKHLPLDWLKTSNMNQNGDCSPVCIFQIISPGMNL